MCVLQTGSDISRLYSNMVNSNSKLFQINQTIYLIVIKYFQNVINNRFEHADESIRLIYFIYLSTKKYVFIGTNID